VLSGPALSGQEDRSRSGFRFRSAVELVNVTATVTDRTGRFVSGLTQDDFVVYEDGEQQTVTHFSNERVPVSLGIALDTSASMSGDKIVSAREALDRFLYDLLSPDDEVFLYRIAEPPQLLEGWTTDRRVLSDALRNVRPRGGTAMYDAVADAVPMAQEGTHRKKALLVISDGNDTSSRINIRELKSLIRETEVLVYAIGIDGRGEPTFTPRPRSPIPIPLPIPIPGRRGPTFPPPGGGGPAPGTWSRSSDRVNVGALREMTDDSGGRTEIIRSARDLDPATENIADELSRQYYLGYTSTRPKDGRWHSIRVDVHGQSLTVRARRGYMASPS
jgi:Ca-activated chloride channel family protein